MSRSGINSRVFTNSFAYRNNSAYRPYYFANYGDSFYNLTKPQYSYQIYNQLANSGAGAATSGRSDRWARSTNQQPVVFNPPALIRK